MAGSITTSTGVTMASTGNAALDKANLESFELNQKLLVQDAIKRNEDLSAQLDNVKNKTSGGQPFSMAPGKSSQIGGSIALDKLYGKSEPGGIHQILGTSAPSSGTDTNLFTVLGGEWGRLVIGLETSSRSSHQDRTRGLKTATRGDRFPRPHRRRALRER